MKTEIKRYRKFSSNHKHLSVKLYLDGKSYKISIKPRVINMRFNRAHRQLLIFKNSIFLNKNGQKRLYCQNAMLWETPIKHLLANIRPANTYTIRGLWSNLNIIDKRTGRISEYM